MNPNNLDEILKLSPTIFNNIQQTEEINFPGEDGLFAGSNVNEISFSNLNFSPDYCYDDNAEKEVDNEATEEGDYHDSLNVRRKSMRIEDQVRSKLAEQIRMENDRIEKEAMMLENNGIGDINDTADLDESVDDFGVVLSSEVKITLKPATQQSSFEAVENSHLDTISNHSTDTSKTQICDDSGEDSNLFESNYTTSTGHVYPRQRNYINNNNYSANNGVMGIKYQSCLEINCFGLTCRKNVTISKSLYCSSTCLKSYVNSIVESSRRILKERFGEKKALILSKNQKLVLLDRRTGEIFSGRQAPRARSEELLKFLEMHPTCQIVRDKFSSQIGKKRPAEDSSKSDSTKAKSAPELVDTKEIYARCDQMKDFFKKILEKQIRESKSLLIINKKRLEEICVKLVEELKSCHCYDGSLELLERHITTLKDFFDSPDTNSKSPSLFLDLVLRGDVPLGEFITKSTSNNQIQTLMRQFKVPAQAAFLVQQKATTSAIKDTTDQHGKGHFFDTNCRICQNKQQAKEVRPSVKNALEDAKETIESVKQKLSQSIGNKEQEETTPPEENKPKEPIDPQDVVETSCAMINLNTDNPCQIDLEMYAEACSDPSHELNLLLGSFMKCTLYPLGNIRPPKLDQTTPNTEPPNIPLLPTFLRITGGFNKRQVAGFVQKHLSYENREVVTYLILPGTMSYIDERSLILYHRFLQNLHGRDSGGILANAEANSLADKFKDLLVYVGEELPFVLNVDAHTGTKEELMRRGLYRYGVVNHENHIKNSSLGKVKLYLILIRKKVNGPRPAQQSLLNPSQDVPETPAFEEDDMEVEELPTSYHPLTTSPPLSANPSTINDIIARKEKSEPVDTSPTKEINSNAQSNDKPVPSSTTNDANRKSEILDALNKLDMKKIISTVNKIFDENTSGPNDEKSSEEFDRKKDSLDYYAGTETRISTSSYANDYADVSEPYPETNGNYQIHNSYYRETDQGYPFGREDLDLRHSAPNPHGHTAPSPPRYHHTDPHRPPYGRPYPPYPGAHAPPYDDPYYRGRDPNAPPYDYYERRPHPNHEPHYYNGPDDRAYYRDQPPFYNHHRPGPPPHDGPRRDHRDYRNSDPYPPRDRLSADRAHSPYSRGGPPHCGSFRGPPPPSDNKQGRNHRNRSPRRR